MSSTDEVIQYYTNFAEHYDTVVLRDGDYIAHLKMPQWIIEALPNIEANILDLGCGTGLGSLPFFKKGYRVTGIDITPKMIEQCRGLPFVRLFCQNLEEPLPILDESFDAVIMLGVMEFIQDVPQLLSRVSKALKHNGLFTFTIPKQLSEENEKKLGIKTYNPSEIQKSFALSGFAIEREEDFQGFVHQDETVLYRGTFLENHVSMKNSSKNENLP